MQTAEYGAVQLASKLPGRRKCFPDLLRSPIIDSGTKIVRKLIQVQQPHAEGVDDR
jgi:hypothetical protein